MQQNKPELNNSQSQKIQLLKKTYFDVYDQDLAIEQLRKINLIQENNAKKLEIFQSQIHMNEELIPKQLLRKLQKLESNFLKQTDINKEQTRANKVLASKLKTEKEQEKKLSEMISRLELHMNSKNRKTGQNQIEIPKSLHSKLIHIYNRYITQNRANQSKREQLESQKQSIRKQQQEIQELKYKLQNKKRQYQQVRLQKLLKQEEALKVNLKVSYSYASQKNQSPSRNILSFT